MIINTLKNTHPASDPNTAPKIRPNCETGIGAIV